MAYWLLKSEPSTFSIDDLSKRPHQTTPWDGVRNYQARNHLKSMKVGDKAFFYHSSCKIPGIAGIVEVVKLAYPEKNQTEHPPRWFSPDVRLLVKLPHILALTELKKHAELKNMLILRKGNRLSVTPVEAREWDYLMKLVKTIDLI